MSSVIEAVVAELDSVPFLVAPARTSNNAIIGKITDGTVVFWNEVAERLYGPAPLDSSIRR